MTPKLSVQVLKHYQFCFLDGFVWEEERQIGRGRREGIATQAWVYVRTEIKKLLQDAEYIGRQEVRAQPTANATGLGAFFGFQMDMIWELCASNLHQISRG